ncbi:MAG: tRNA (adenosine(37)-N6)-threonylcarbamoyltransferase complex ATPase subunit type 1 TsaE [bacterium]|nr:tRNA (adenosine(37)-N6)-threonylcarbamoyltransferase complex ATPase subunit type 1 TsaE [bacterium]
MRRAITRSEVETERLGEELARRRGGDVVVLLEGDLGSGKTVLVRGIARALGIDGREVQSPTYNLIHEHEGTAGRLVHVDLYRLEGDEIESLGLDELLTGPGIKAVEWAERLGAGAWPGAVRVRLERLAGGEREVTIREPASAGN